MNKSELLSVCIINAKTSEPSLQPEACSHSLCGSVCGLVYLRSRSLTYTHARRYDGSSTILGSDAVKLTTVGLLGLLTGYSATCCLMVAPAMVKTKFKEYAAQFMSMCLIVGLFVGSLIGVLVEKVMQIEGVKGGGASVPYLHWGGGDGGSGAGDGPVFENLN